MFITRFIADLKIVKEPNSLGVVTSTTVGNKRWIPQPSGTFKFNVEVGVSRNGSRGTAVVVCRDEKTIIWDLQILNFQISKLEFFKMKF